MNTATPIPNAYVPSAKQLVEGRFWLTFHNGGTFAEYKSMPNALRYEDRTYIKRGWNSDTYTVSYVEGVPAVGV